MSHAELRNSMSSLRQADVLRLHVEIEAVIAPITSDSARLDAAERSRQVAVVFRVDPDHACLDTMRHSKRTSAVAGPDVRRQAVLRIVGERQCLSFIGE